MRLGNTMIFNMLSVVIPKNGHSTLYTELVSKHALEGMDHEVIVAPSWLEGMMQSRGEFICFLDEHCDFPINYFKNNLHIFNSQPLFKKLAMISPAVDVETNHHIYGYILSLEGIEPVLAPSRIKTSSEPYKAQIGYLPGAMVRRSSIRRFNISNHRPIASSVNVSLDIWQNGSMVYINPQAIYRPKAEERIDIPVRLKGLPKHIEATQVLWRQQMVG